MRIQLHDIVPKGAAEDTAMQRKLLTDERVDQSALQLQTTAALERTSASGGDEGRAKMEGKRDAIRRSSFEKIDAKKICILHASAHLRHQLGAGMYPQSSEDGSSWQRCRLDFLF
jgi:hypothetical protein